jgi:hypothetical protein
MKTKVLTLAVSLKRIKIHESILEFDSTDDTECKLASISLRRSLGLQGYSLFHFIDGQRKYYLSKGKDFDKLNTCFMIDLENPNLLYADYEGIKKILLEEIKTNYIPPNGENVFHIHFN